MDRNGLPWARRLGAAVGRVSRVAMTATLALTGWVTTTDVATAATWTTCASEGSFCNFTGTRAVRYGAGTQFSAPRTLTAVNGGVACNNAVFGDPAMNVVKRCEVDTDMPAAVTWTRCATEGSICSFTGTRTVRYGANARYGDARTVSAVNGGIACNNAVFGDPVPNVVKACELSSAGGTPTNPTPPNPPAQGAPSIASFTASPASVLAGQAATLRWTVSQATGLSIAPNVGTVTGTSVEVRPTTTTTYTLTARNAAGPTTATVTVVVNPAGGSGAAVQITRSTKHQTIEGFGFFGAKRNWWDSLDPAAFHDAPWLDRVIDDLGITMWRNEMQPNNPVGSATSVSPQDATWEKQRPMIAALKAKADASRVPLRFLLTVWSPPGEWKMAATMGWPGDTAATRGGTHAGGTKNGGTLNPARYGDYAQWLGNGLQLYRDLGIDVYALSLQNEPQFIEYYNSAIYTSAWYGELIENVVPAVKNRFPNVRIFGSENMLEIEAAADSHAYHYHNALKNRPNALRLLDRWAVHGYSDGIAATATARHRDLWERHHREFQLPTNKPAWMTETSGFNSEWDTGATDAFDLGIAIHAALYHGKAAAWVHWAGAGELIPNGGTPSKQYHVSKQFFRYIRPDARMVALSTGDTNVLGAAFEHSGLNNFVVVLINQASTARTVNLAGDDIPAQFNAVRTSATENSVDVGTMPRGQVVLAPKSITTLVNGCYRE